jgi:hypothetical protein
MAQETKFKFADYDGGLKSHPSPEPSGTLVLTPSGKWELHYAGGFGKRDRWINGPLVRFPLEAHETSDSSCRVTISDIRDPTVSASFDLPATPAAALREAVAKRLRESGFILAMPIANYDGGLPVHPVPEPAGTLTLWSSLWKLAFGDDTVIKGAIPRFAFVVEGQEPSSCHVQMYDTADPTIRGGFDVPATSADELRQALVDAGQQTVSAHAPGTSSGQLATGQDSPWWQGLEPHTILSRCHYAGAKNAKEMGALKVTAAGIEYAGGTKISCPWSGIANIEVLESRTHRGRQRSAVGIGPVGLAVVGASMLQNKRAAQVVVRRVVRITTTQGQKGDFIPADSSAQQLAPAQAIVARLRAAQAAVAQVAPAPFVADELKKLADLKDAGLLTNEEFARQKVSLLG